MTRGTASLLLICALASAALAQQAPTRLEIWDLKLGTPLADLSDDFTDYACGTGGGPPSVAITGWKDYRRCRPEPNGLREVYFRYDDELEYWAKANNLPTEIERFSGTKVYNFPVVLSALFNESGILAGLRVISDPRDSSRRREEAYSLRNFLTSRFGRDGWDCAELPPEEGEGPVARTFIKQHCRKLAAGVGRLDLRTHYFRKKGQSQFDPRTDRE